MTSKETSFENNEAQAVDSSYVPFIYYQDLLGASPKKEEEMSNYSMLRSVQEDNLTLKEALEKIKVLEDVCAHLNNQMKIMKKLISAQINDIRRTTEEQGNYIFAEENSCWS